MNVKDTTLMHFPLFLEIIDGGLMLNDDDDLLSVGCMLYKWVNL